MTEFTQAEQIVFDSVARHSGTTGVNPLTVANSLPRVDVYAVMQRLIGRGILERVGGGVKIAECLVPTPVPEQTEKPFAEPQPQPAIWKQKRKYFSPLNPRKNLKRQMASRIVFYLAHISTGSILYMTLYKNLHASRYRDYSGHDLWAEALEYLGTAICRRRGMIWLERETKRVSKLPWPYLRMNRAKPPRKKRPRSAWFDDIARRAEASGLDIKEQIAADRGAQVAVTNT